jgi:diacylglycerol kinase (ATP)
MPRVVVIGNPSAGRGALRKHADTIVGALGDAELQATERPGHAVELARAAREQGVQLVVAAGGDGTVHEVVNGLLADGAGSGVPTLGVIPLGSGCDYVKTFGVPQDVAGALATLTSDAPPREVDAGHISYEGGSTYFVNIAEVGIGAEVVDRAARLPRVLGGAVYLAGFCLTLPSYRRRPASIDVDGRTSDVQLTNLVCAIGQVFGGGMRVAPDADPSDGLFDIQVQTGSKLDYVRGIPKVYRGTHIPHPRVQQERGAVLAVRCTPAALIEADGEVLGRTPAEFRIVGGALELKA